MVKKSLNLSIMRKPIIRSTIIIDDPTLKENYGFLNYRELLNLMDRYNFCTSIAFIPWNYKRTSPRIAALFRERPDRFSLCVHGCDHTKGEFGKTDLSYLELKVELATARMIEHERRTGIPFDRIMVFPQGVFTNEALETLKIFRYLAAVNTEPDPVNSPLTSEFPLFIRQLPCVTFNKLYSPMFFVLHHDYFRYGYDCLSHFIATLNSMYNMKWDTVGNNVRQYISTDITNELNIRNFTNIDISGVKYNGYIENTKIFMRRHACELRDNYLCRNYHLNKLVRLFKRAKKTRKNDV